MAERQQDHQHEMEKASAEAAATSERRGTWSALIVALCAFVLAGYLIANGHALTGLAPLLVPLAPLVGVFFAKRSRRERDNGNGDN